jgi:Tfp pilus assembly protein PilF
MLAPNDHKARTVLARILDALGHRRLESEQYHTAISILSEAITLDGFHSNFYLHRALAYIAIKKWTSALHDADCSVRVDSTNCDAFILRAKLHWKVGMRKEGNEDFKRAHKLDPHHIEVKKFEQKMWDQAEQAYQTASSYLLSNNFAGAIDLLSSALELNPGDVKVLVLRASAFRQQGSFQQALEDLEEAREIYCFNQDQPKKPVDSNTKDSDGIFEHPEITRQRNLTLNDMAVDKFQHKHYQEAITLFNKVIVAETQSARMFVT